MHKKAEKINGNVLCTVLKILSIWSFKDQESGT